MWHDFRFPNLQIPGGPSGHHGMTMFFIAAGLAPAIHVCKTRRKDVKVA
jgi:hypothetical protein